MQVLKKEYIERLTILLTDSIEEPSVVAPAMELLASLAMNPKNVVQLYELGVVITVFEQFQAYHNRE